MPFIIGGQFILGLYLQNLYLHKFKALILSDQIFFSKMITLFRKGKFFWKIHELFLCVWVFLKIFLTLQWCPFFNPHDFESYLNFFGLLDKLILKNIFLDLLLQSCCPNFLKGIGTTYFMLIFISFDKIWLICICLLHSAFLTLLLSCKSLHPTLHFNFQKLALNFFSCWFYFFW